MQIDCSTYSQSLSCCLLTSLLLCGRSGKSHVKPSSVHAVLQCLPEYERLKAVLADTEQMKEDVRTSLDPLPAKSFCRSKHCVNPVCIAAEALAVELPGMAFDLLRDIVIESQQFDWYGERVKVGSLQPGRPDCASVDAQLFCSCLTILGFLPTLMALIRISKHNKCA